MASTLATERDTPEAGILMTTPTLEREVGPIQIEWRSHTYVQLLLYVFQCIGNVTATPLLDCFFTPPFRPMAPGKV